MRFTAYVPKGELEKMSISENDFDETLASSGAVIFPHGYIITLNAEGGNV
jgi:nitrogen fixation protein